MKISACYWMFEGGLEARKPICRGSSHVLDMRYTALDLM
jgi:hypothetical protein